MAKATLLKLTKVNGTESQSHGSNRYNDSDEDTNQGRTPPPLGVPVVVAVDAIRCFNPRKNNAPGTRLTFKDGGGFAVRETFDAVLAALGVTVTEVEAPPPAVSDADVTTQPN